MAAPTTKPSCSAQFMAFLMGTGLVIASHRGDREPPPGWRAPLDLLEGALVRREPSAVVDRVDDREPLGLAPLRQHVLPPRPLGARRTDVGAPSEATPQTREAVADHVDPRERSAVE